MKLKARILTVVLLVLPLSYLLIVVGITYEVVHTKKSVREMRHLLLREAAEGIYSADLLSKLRGLPPLPPGPREVALVSAIGALDRRRESPDQLLAEWALYKPDGTWMRGDEALLPDDPGARALAISTEGPVVSDETGIVWRRLQLGTGAEATTVGVLAMRFSVSVEMFSLTRQLRLIVISCLLGIVAVTSMLLWILGRMVFVPVSRLAEGAQRVSAGNYEHRVPLSGTSGELAQFTEVFNDMVAHVQNYSTTLEAKVTEATAQVRASEKRLAVASRLAATGRLAAEIAHEINNPVGGMINAARTLKTRALRGDLDPERAATYLDLILDGLARVEKTVKDVLLFARREVRAAPLDLAPPIERAVTLMRHRAEIKSVVLIQDVEPDLPPVYGDSAELQQVFLNLLVNAVDATAEGGEIRIEAHAEVAEGRVVVTVRDTGCGMPQDVREHAFDPFFTTKAEGEGTGIGLAIVHNIITSHNGEILIASAPGEGTLFRIVLPIHGEDSGHSGD